jgi:NTP pyrophosphatase (non-canonical NTP hydrolase)
MNKQIQEVMDILQEECAEVIQMISKIRRFGLDKIHLKNGGTNRFLLNEELGDLLAMIDLLQSFNIVTAEGLMSAKLAKIEKLKKWSTIYDQEDN